MFLDTSATLRRTVIYASLEVLGVDIRISMGIVLDKLTHNTLSVIIILLYYIYTVFIVWKYRVKNSSGRSTTLRSAIFILCILLSNEIL